jgi:pimeloyl-ACP methyl ester carboxylesterase
VVFYNSSDGNKLAGTLVKPLMMNANTPVAVLISGSGQQNRDEELMEHKPFWVIADLLARNGIATLRYDDRGVGGSEATGLATATTASFKDDALAAIVFLKNRGLKNIGVIGHSEGGLIAFMLGAEVEGLNFVISLAGTAVSGDQILIEQNRLLLEKSGVSADIVNSYCTLLNDIYSLKRSGAQFDRESKITELKAKYPNLPLQMTGNIAALLQPQPWIDFFISYDPTEALKKIGCRVLALNGSNDVQVIASQNINALQKHVESELLTTKIYPELNHLFQHSNTGMPNEYYQIEETISPEVLKDIVDWIKMK